MVNAYAEAMSGGKQRSGAPSTNGASGGNKVSGDELFAMMGVKVGG